MLKFKRIADDPDSEDGSDIDAQLPDLLAKPASATETAEESPKDKETADGESSEPTNTKDAAEADVIELEDEQEPTTSQANVDEVMKEDEDLEDKDGEADKAEENDEDDEELYVVESIVAHRATRKGKQYKERWEGYGPADDTWEPHDSLMESASLKVEEYLAAQEETLAKGSSKKRKRLSALSDVLETNTLNKKRRQNGSLSGVDAGDPESSEQNDEVTTTKESKKTHQVPGIKLESWEEEAIVETIEKDNNNHLYVLLEWPGTKQKSRHPAALVYKKMPQAMLRFYESNLVFKVKKS